MALSREAVIIAVTTMISMFIIVSVSLYTVRHATDAQFRNMVISAIENGFESVDTLPSGAYVVISLPRPLTIEFQNSNDTLGNKLLKVYAGEYGTVIPNVQLYNRTSIVLFASEIYVRKVYTNTTTYVTYVEVSTMPVNIVESRYVSGQMVLSAGLRAKVANLTISTDSPETYSDFIVTLKIPYLSGMREDFGDLLFTYDNGSNAPYYVRYFVPGKYAVVDLKLDRLSSTSPVKLKMYYASDKVKYYGDPNSVYTFFTTFETRPNYTAKIGDFYITYDSFAYSNVLVVNSTEPALGYSNYSAVYFVKVRGNYVTRVKYLPFNETSYAGIVCYDPATRDFIEVGVYDNHIYYTYGRRIGRVYNVTNYYYDFEFRPTNYIDLTVVTEKVNGTNYVSLNVNGAIFTISQSDVEGNMLDFSSDYEIGIFSTTTGTKFSRVIISELPVSVNATIEIG